MAIRSKDDQVVFAVDRGWDARRANYTSSTWYAETNKLPKAKMPIEFEPWFKGRNNETMYLAHLLANNPILMGLLVVKCAILNGKGLVLYNEDEQDDDGNPKMVPFKDWPVEISDWFEFNELESFFFESMLDYHTVGNVFSQVIFSKGRDKITDLVRIAPETVRASMATNSYGKPKNYGISSDWYNKATTLALKTIDGYNKDVFYDDARKMKTNSPVAEMLMHLRMPTVHYPVYGIPPWYGARHWVEVSNMIAPWHKSQLANGNGLRMQITVSMDYIQKKMEKYNADTEEKPTLQQVLTDIGTDFSDYLTNPSNQGKAVVTPANRNEKGDLLKWITFDPIKTEMKDDAFANLDNMMTQAVTSSTGTSPELAGVILPKSLGSGSELRLAWNIEQEKAFHLVHMILKPLAFIHKFNRWPKNYKWGIHQVQMTTTDISRDGIVSTSTPEDNAV